MAVAAWSIDTSALSGGAVSFSMWIRPTGTAIDAQRALWAGGSHRRVGWNDLLLSAVAARHRLAVLHYDADFGAIAAVADVRTAWVVPAGSVP